MQTANIDQRFQKIKQSRTFQNIVKLEKLNQASVLDIGCSNGEYLSHFGKGSTGVTINPEEAKEGTNRGLDMIVGNIEDKSFVLDKKYDVVYANNLLEHLYSPHQFLVTIKKYLNEDGRIIIGVPCIPKMVWLMHFRLFRGSLADAHINFFTKDSLQKTIERAGFEVTSNRGFKLVPRTLDSLGTFFYPHFYVVAKKQKDFDYSAKRKVELAGYGQTPYLNKSPN
jgi:SAM-dependent methyltransferase